MKGKKIFSAKIANEIKSKLEECRLAGRYENMGIRSALRRKYSFFISDFNRVGKSFTAENFDHHVSTGEIQIVDDSNVCLLEDLACFQIESNASSDRIENLAQRIIDESGLSKEELQLLLLSLDIVK